MKANGWLRLGSMLLWAALGSWAVPASAQSLQVTSANPNTAPQGSTNLIVKIGGSGFKAKGNSVAFYVTGSTTDNGGITVNSASFVSSSELDANITVSSTATLSGFDIYVTSGGRTGKGTDLFTVTSGGSSQCVTQGAAAGWTKVDVLNPDINGTPKYTGGTLGTAVRVKLVSVGGVPQFYAGLAGSGAGDTIAFILNLDGTIRRSWLVLSDYGGEDIAVGDVNGDGAPDFVLGGQSQIAAHIFIGHVFQDSSGTWQYNIDPTSDVYSLPLPSNPPTYFGFRVAMGDLNGDGFDEVIVAGTGGGSGKKAQPGAAYIYSYNSSSSSPFTLSRTITDPAALVNDDFGSGLAVGELTTDSFGTSVQDLAVAASGAGLVYVFENPLGSTSSLLTFPVPTSDVYGSHVGIADVTGDGIPDLIAVSGSSGGQPEAQVLAGPLVGGELPTYILQPDPSLAQEFGTGFDLGDIDGDGRADVLVGAPNASYSSSCSGGAAYVFRTNSTVFPSYSDLFETPEIGSTQMGRAMGAAAFNTTAGDPIVLIGESGATVGTQAGAGQVYIYMYNPGP